MYGVAGLHAPELVQGARHVLVGGGVGGGVGMRKVASVAMCVESGVVATRVVLSDVAVTVCVALMVCHPGSH